MDILEQAARHYGSGKEQKSSKGWTTLCPVHDDKRPSLSLWLDGKGQLAGRCMSGCPGKEVYEKLVADNFIVPRGKMIAKRDIDKWVTPIPIEAEPPETCRLSKKLGSHRPVNRWALKDKSGNVLLYEVRFQIKTEDGSIKKLYRRLAYFIGKDGYEGWSWHEPPETPLPLYGLERVKDNKSILLLEGCKTADAAQRIFKDIPCLAWISGALRFKDTDWSQLAKGTEIVIWPDADIDGERCVTGPGSLPLYLRSLGFLPRVVQVHKHNLPKGWDLADPLPESWSINTLSELLKTAVEVEELEDQFLQEYCVVAFNKEQLPTKCGLHELCRDCLQVGRVDNPEDILKHDKLTLEWVYVDQQSQWYNVYDGRLLRKEGFNQSLAREGYDVAGKYSASNGFLSDPGNTFVFDLDFWPGKRVTFQDELERTRVNTWRQWLTKPMAGEPTPWLDLLQSLIPDAEVRAHIVKWLAFTVQHPDRKINYGLLLISHTQGVGKDSLLYPVEQTMGRAARNIQADVLGRDSDEYLMGTKLLVIQELNLYGRRGSLYDKLKPILAAPPRHLMVNRKYIKEFEIHNMVNVVAFSNHDRPLNIEDKDRRLLVYRTAEKTFDKHWFKSYYDWVDKKEGYRQVYQLLLDEDLTEFNAGGHAPMTADKKNLITASDPILEEVMGLIEERHPPFHGDLFTVGELQQRLSNEGYRMSTVRLGKKLTQLEAKGIKKLRLVQSRREGLRLNLWACRNSQEWEPQEDHRLLEAHQRREVLGEAHPGLEPELIDPLSQ